MQVNSATPQGSFTSVAVPFTTAQTAGNLNVVVVGWNDTVATVSSVTDTNGNSYQVAVGPTTWSGGLRQSIYSAKNTAPATAGANVVTVAFSRAARYPDVRIVEYSGIDPVNPVDVTAVGTGSSATSSTAAVTTSSAADLLFAANTVEQSTNAAGTGFTKRIITVPDGDLVEDRLATAAGSYSATATLVTGGFVMQMVAFRAAGGTPDTQPPTAPSALTATAASSSQINLGWTASTDNAGVTSYLVESCAGAGCTSYAQVGTTSGTTFSNTGLTPSSSYSYRVRATDAAGNLSGYSGIATATTQAPPDTQPPTAPSGAAAAAVSSSQINLGWSASTDNVGVTAYLVERCPGASCSSFIQISANATSPYSDTGLTANTAYSYRVRATDAAGNLSGYSNTATATTQVSTDTQAPSAPAGLTATAASSTQVNLGWTASTDNVGVTGYQIEGCSGAGCSAFAPIGTATGTTYTHVGLAASTSYSYRVRATDAAGNLSAYSAIASATTPGVSVAPRYVQGNYEVPQSATAVPIAFTLAQNAGDLNVVIVGWNDSVAQVASVTDTKGNIYTRAAGPTVVPGAVSQSIYYAAGIAAAPANGNTVTVAFSQAASYPDVRILEYGGIASAAAVDVTVASTGNSAASSTAAVTTTNSTDLLVMANMVTSSTSAAGTGFTKRLLTSPDGDIAEDRVVTAAGSYSASATLAYPGDWIAQMVAFRAAGGAPDTQPPTAPSGLSSTAVSSSQINLGWTAATDNVGVTSYLVESCAGTGCSGFAQIGTTAANTFSNTGLAAGTTYSYRVRAADAAGNLGPYSGVASATTQSPDTAPPSAPTSLLANAPTGTQIDLSWTAATDNVGVTGYRIESCAGAGCTGFAQIGISAATVFSNTGLTAGTTYSYRVRAADAAGNLGPYSGTATATTQPPDTQPPTAPASLAANATTTTRVDLTWTASTDNVGVASYLIERCQAPGCTGFAQVGTSATTAYGDTGVTGNTSYSYRVRAVDAAGNLGGYSNTATAITPAQSSPPPAFVQGSYATPQTPQTSVPVAFASAQKAGDLNVVVVGWNDTSAHVGTVSDSKGNIYGLAVGPTLLSAGLTQAIYFSSNIAAAAAGANTVTVTFSPAAAYPDVRILEYSGIVTSNPIDGTAASSGNSALSSSGFVATTNPVDLLLAANIVQTATGAAGAGYTSRMITGPDGDIVEDQTVMATGSYSASAAVGAGGWVMQLVAFKSAATPPAPDTTPPTVTITSPLAGATLNGTTTVNVSASDSGSSVIAVQLLVDGTPVGQPDASAPYSFSLNTASFANGAHTIGAAALDLARNQGTAPPVAVTFSNATAGNPAVTGLWSGTTPVPIISVHQSLLPNGRILMSDGQSFGPDARVWDYRTNGFTSVPVPANVFCSGEEQMADGRILVVGGHNNSAHSGLTVANVFDPVTQSWTVLPDMTYPRWYPTPMMLPNGHLLVLAGETNCNGCNVLVPEIYDPDNNAWTRVTAAPFDFPYYPHAYVLSDGRVLVAATSEEPIVSQILDLNLHTWTAVGGAAVDGGSSIMYRPGKFLKTGTSIDPDLPSINSAATAYALDLTQGTPAWRQVAPMNFARTFHTLTALPDGNVLVTGGGPTTAATDTARAIRAAEMWSPATETWTTLASMNAPRLYHSAALLLPDGRVAILGGGRFDDTTVSTDQFNAEFFSPPYLFKGPRPTIASAPAVLQYGQPFTVQTADAARIASVALIRFGSVTHAINIGQRYLPLAFTANAGSLTVTAPVNANLAPPGNYMLFIVDTNGVPSVASAAHF